jgi:hypothetical protein
MSHNGMTIDYKFSNVFAGEFMFYSILAYNEEAPQDVPTMVSSSCFGVIQQQDQEERSYFVKKKVFFIIMSDYIFIEEKILKYFKNIDYCPCVRLES